MSAQILLGFEIGTGESVYMEQKHTVALGMTQAGKTTTLEAIVSRTPNAKALAFKTKRGETGFSNYHDIPLYYKSRTDWRYLEALLNTALREKIQYQPFMRWAVMQVTKNNPQTLREVMQNAHAAQEDKRFSRRKDVFELLEAYLQIVVPELEKFTFSETLELSEGINVMDISSMTEDTQYLVIGACIEYVHEKLEGIIVIVPEAWDSLPQGRTTPVKLAAEKFIRKGAAIGNRLYLDSQDIAGIDKQPLRQCDNWIMGRMKETNEVDRLKEYLPKNVRIESAEQFRSLPLGQFFAVLGDDMKKVYVLPAGVPESMGRDVALGKRSVEEVKSFLKKNQEASLIDCYQIMREEAKQNAQKMIEEREEEMYKEKYEDEQKKNVELAKENKILSSQRTTLLSQVEEYSSRAEKAEEAKKEAEDNVEQVKELAKAAAEQLEKANELNKNTIQVREAFKKLIFPDGLPIVEVNTPAIQADEDINIDLRLKAVEDQIKNIRVAPAAGAQSVNLTVESPLTEIVVENAAPKEVVLTKDKFLGKVMYFAIQYAQKVNQTFSSKDIRDYAGEHGVTFDNVNYGKNFNQLVNQGYIISEGGAFRLPKNLPIRVIDKEDDKSA